MSPIEGWLQMPVERNLIGRAGTWKSRYVKFGTHSPTSRTSAVSPIRPPTATGVDGIGLWKNGKLSEQKPHCAGSISDGIESAPLLIYLTIYKQRNDTEPFARYPLTSISSCYIGDVASRQSKKKSVILPTMIVNLRGETHLPSSKSFKRRSHDVPTREEIKKENPGKEILYFRTNPLSENGIPIGKWVKQIQNYLIPDSSDSILPSTVESAFWEKLIDVGQEAHTSSPSLFIINGEPSTTLLSPSLRSRASNLSSIESDDKASVLSSSASEIPSPRMNEESPRSPGKDVRPSLHVATKLQHLVGGDSRIMDEGFQNTPAVLPTRRETILDRFFSSTAPSSPSLSFNSAPMNSIDRFEALIRDIECGRDLRSADDYSIFTSYPKRIPSPTQRALEYVSTGLLDHPPHDSDIVGLRSSREPSQIIEPPVNISVGCLSFSISRPPSQTSLGATPSLVNSKAGGKEGWGGGSIEANLDISNAKRHSIADLSMKLSTAPPLLQLATSRRGSHSDIPRISEPYDNMQTTLASTSRRDFSKHSRATRPLFREFSF